MTGDPAVAGLEVYIVGGAVRDRLLGRPIHDRDWVVVGTTPAQMRARGFQQVGKDFPVFLHPKTHEEYALARTERKRGPGHRGFTCDASPDITLEADLARRDLTINAMAEDADGRVIDPFDGASDLAARRLRHVSPAFSEDPLRVFRVARFAAVLGFSTAPETLALMGEMARSGELRSLSAERVWQETEKALRSAQPSAYFSLLGRCQALDDWFAELADDWRNPAKTAKLPVDDAHPAHDRMRSRLGAALDAAAAAGDSLSIRAAMVLGSPGLPAVEQLTDRLRLPNQIRETVVLSQTVSPLVRAASGEHLARVSLLLEHDGLRRPQRLNDAISACCRVLGVDAGPLLRWLEAARERIEALDYSTIAAAADARGAIPGKIREAQLAELSTVSFPVDETAHSGTSS